MDITELLAFAVKNKASDLHLSAGLPPMIRVHGDIRRINLPPMEHEDVHAMVYDIMSDAQRKMYEENLECDFSFGVPTSLASASTRSSSSVARRRHSGRSLRRCSRSRSSPRRKSSPK